MAAANHRIQVGIAGNADVLTFIFKVNEVNDGGYTDTGIRSCTEQKTLDVC